MSIDESTNNVTAIEADLHNLLQAKKARLSDASRQADNDYSSLVSGISVRSVREIDHLIEGLQGLRQKLDSDGDRLYRQIVQHAALNQSVVELTKIVSDGMASVNKTNGV